MVNLPVANPAYPWTCEDIADCPDIHDLGVVLDRLNHNYFNGKLDLRITWGSACRRPAQRSIKVGAYLVEDRLIRVLDITNAANPVQAGRPFTLPGSITGLAIDGNRLYAAAYSDVYIVSLANPLDPKMLGVYTGISAAHAVAARGNALYIGDDYHGLVTVDVSQPATPTYSSLISIPAPVNNLVMTGTLLVATTEGVGYNKVNTIDLADPLHLVARPDELGQEGAQLIRLKKLGEDLAGVQNYMARLQAGQSAAGGLLAGLGMWAVLTLAIPLVRSRQIEGVYLPIITLAALSSFEAILPLPLAAQYLENHLEAARRDEDHLHAVEFPDDRVRGYVLDERQRSDLRQIAFTNRHGRRTDERKPAVERRP